MNDKKRKFNDNLEHSLRAASTAEGDAIPDVVAKLTKQQKRDAKRAGIKVSENVKILPTSSTSDCPVLKAVAGASVYKRVPVLPPDSPFPLLNVDRFLNPSDKNFQKVLETCYDGFQLDSPNTYDDKFHQSFETSFMDMEKSGVFQFDLTQPAGLGTKVAKTFVTRCLVGEPGITYKYLGLRMFSYPWDGSDECSTFATIGGLNKILADRTATLLKESKRPEVGSCNYNLTLINRCYPINGEVKMKLEPTFQKEKCTVSWHADSTLEHYSSIAVYHCTKPQKTKKNPNPKETEDNSWRISLRVCPNAEGPKAGKLKNPLGANSAESESESLAPPLAVPLGNKWSYYLLDDFNHHHQHSVLAGKTDRYASTHRVSRTDGHTFLSIKKKCLAALQGTGASPKQVRSEQLVLNELEFEWIRQFYIQGSKHRDLHKWWHGPMGELMDLWGKLESRTKVLIQTLQDASEDIGNEGSGPKNPENSDPSFRAQDNRDRKLLAKRRKRASAVTAASFEAAIEGLTERQSKREGWLARAEDPAFLTVLPDCQPLTPPFPTHSTENLDSEDLSLQIPKGTETPKFPTQPTPSGEKSSSNKSDKNTAPSSERANSTHQEPDSLLEVIETMNKQHQAFLLLNT